MEIPATPFAGPLSLEAGSSAALADISEKTAINMTARLEEPRLNCFVFNFFFPLFLVVVALDCVQNHQFVVILVYR